ncbi:hypothetical protein [Massilia sp. METH4]|uniref:hypothetical protein n=1 Tax=Massilia sp. METH4 TaxID=3123041 RepID=UPI0030D57471
MVKKILCTGLLALCASASGENLFAARDFAGWELRTDPAAATGDVFTLLPSGAIASTGKPSGFLENL